MILDQEKIMRIKRLLKSRPKGLTISDISQILKLNRNSVAKYLEILLITGQVEMRLYGNAKVYSLSQRVPISSMLKFATELILILDSDQKIIDVNDNFLSFFSVQKESLLGNDIRSTGIPGLSDSIPVEMLSDSTRMGEGKREICFTRDGTEYYLALKIVPTVFDDGSRGFTLIFEDVTLPRSYKQQLEINEARYRAIVEDQTELICRYNRDFLITFVNDAMCQYVGLPREEIIGKDFLSQVYEHDRDIVKKNILSLCREQPYLSYEQRVLDPQGNIRWQYWTNRAIFDESGEIVEYQGVGRDITDRKHAEENLLVMNMAIASSINGIGLATLDGRITYANAAFLRMFGIDRLEDILGKHIETLANPLNPGPGAKDVLQALREKGSWKGEILLIRKDGTRVHTHHTANMIKDKNGSPIAMMSSFIDITEKVEAEREIRIRNTAIESAMNGIIISDSEDRLIYANKAFLSIFGAKDTDDIRHKYVADFWKIAEDIVPPIEEIKRSLDAEGKWSGELHVRLPGGNSRFFQVSATKVRDTQGAPLCEIETFMDITNQKAMEKALKTTYEKLEDAIEFMPDPTFIVGREKRVIAWNRALETLSGVRSEDIIGSNTYQDAFGFLGGTRPILVDILDLPAHELAKSYPNIRRFKDSIFVESVIPGGHEGKGIYMWGKATPLFDRDGNIIGAIESFRDMSEWRRAKETLQPQTYMGGTTPQPSEPAERGGKDELASLERAFDHLREGVAILDRKARIQVVNPPFLAIAKSGESHLVGRDFLQFCHPEDAPLISDFIFHPEKERNGSRIFRIHAKEMENDMDAEISAFGDSEGILSGHFIVTVPQSPLPGQR
ncbi:MAG TPA: PAS domain S-box protein [Methanolinea sp.]|nr:PAS domain S-box protein [Methanolinea sp.]HQK56311.1 PAS domain S-box protein [Methanolinea sp.]